MRQRLQDPAWQKYIQSAIDAANADPPLGAIKKSYWSSEERLHQQRVEDSEVRHRATGFLDPNRRADEKASEPLSLLGEFTPSLKLKRSVAEETWKDLIDPLF